MTEGGVKGLGPLQLLNFAFKKGAIRDAVNESNEIERTHDRMEREMEETYGLSDYRTIRRAILKKKAREKTKADYDEETFDEEAEANIICSESDDVPPATSLVHRRRSVAMPKSPRSSMPENIAMTRMQKLKWKYGQAKSSVKDFLKSLGTFFFLFGNGVMESLISYLMRMSRDYRYIAYILQEEKRIHKQLFNASVDTEDDNPRLAHQAKRAKIRERLLEEHKEKPELMKDESFRKLHMVLTEQAEQERIASQPGTPRLQRAHELEEQSEPPNPPANEDDVSIYEEIHDPVPIVPTVTVQYPAKPDEVAVVIDDPTEAETTEVLNAGLVRGVEKHPSSDKDERLSARKDVKESMFVRLVTGVYYAVLSHSELICYAMVVLNHVHSASLISMILPMLMLLWGTLSVPMPTRRFWIVVISYTEIIVVLKYVFQFGFFPWNQDAPSLDPFWAPRILGIERRPQYALWDLVLLMTLFLHRNNLMSIGLWRNEADEHDPEAVDNDDSKASDATSFLTPTRGVKKLRAHSITELLADLHLNKAEIKHRMKHRAHRVQGFFESLVSSDNRFPEDLYAPMFICDAICFVIVIFGYSAFGTDHGSGSVTSYFEENKVPGMLVAMLILQFVLMVIDRALFLRKFLLGKLIFQILLVIFVHVWMFLLLPAATGRLFVNNFVLKLWYAVKCIYFVLSAKQIRSGYPKRQLAHISKSFTTIYYFLYKIYMVIPFLFELSMLMDWMWRDTSLSLSNWIALHDIYSVISLIKCERKHEENYPTPKGVKKRPLIKYGYGGILLLFIIGLIWFPLILFSMSNTVGIRSLPVECTCKLTIAGYQPLFESTAQLGDIRELTYEEYDTVYYTYRTSKAALSYIADYDPEDVVIAVIEGNSASRWQISPPARQSLTENLNGSVPMSLQFTWNFKRAPDETLMYGNVEDTRTIQLAPGDPIRMQFIEANAVSVLLNERLKEEEGSVQDAFINTTLELNKEDGLEWWKLRMIDPMYDPMRVNEPVVRESLVFYGFVDKVFAKSWSFLTGGGILGLYVSIVFVLGHYVRGLVSDSMQKIMFEELPNVDRILNLCQDIFLVRDAGEFEMEEELFAKLVFIFRSPATLIKWTREKPM
ncbi:piezo-type mechanosensitive ion channel component 1 [Aphelenchoides avenae]|nr:piezo-type mechanosensitive ion channel component 1 [Aphelenchus avenae]